MTEPELKALPGGSLRGWPLQVLRVETMKLQAAVWTDDLSQIWRRTGQARNFHSECLFARRTTGKRIAALHMKTLHEDSGRDSILPLGHRKCKSVGASISDSHKPPAWWKVPSPAQPNKPFCIKGLMTLMGLPGLDLFAPPLDACVRRWRHLTRPRADKPPTPCSCQGRQRRRGQSDCD
jgi:hypothetical protein